MSIKARKASCSVETTGLGIELVFGLDISVEYQERWVRVNPLGLVPG